MTYKTLYNVELIHLTMAASTCVLNGLTQKQAMSFSKYFIDRYAPLNIKDANQTKLFNWFTLNQGARCGVEFNRAAIRIEADQTKD